MNKLQQGAHVLLPAEVLQVLEQAEEGLLPFRSFVEDVDRDVMVIPSHLVAPQELIDAFSSMADAIPSREFNSMMRQMLFIREQLDYFERTMPQTSVQATLERTARGQLKISIDSNTLCELVEKEFSDSTIAIMLGTSLRTVERRRAELGLRKRGGPAISDEELHAAIRSTYTQGFSAGERGMRGALRCVGVRVSRERMRLAMQEVDPQQLQARWAKTIRRRDYYVPFVNSLWHVDGHHKLIRYKIVIHGGIDGKSRVVTFMQANSNNRADTVASCFRAATQQWGWPSRVRADHGGENLKIKAMMEHARGHHRGSFVQGPSTRNQRIERLWVDLQAWTTGTYKTIFGQLEADGLLDTASPVHLWCLHLVFLP
ncbi:hypothetical protein A4X06_0g4822 [Tilletia controversa]|uniref:Integrase core domain-containing protein n=1 Tax=Tilletia controversa TaxID=13291 RepID=A0A8X7SW50_9BASI|nr:hypothetical protein A4X06_0g4822 [Tilletia controversa]